MKLYLETSIPNFLFADDAPEKQRITKMFFKEEAIKHEIFISPLVITEIDKCPEPKRTRLNNVLKEMKPILLSVTEEAVKLAKKYIEEGIIPQKDSDDALHIGIATINNMDAIASWNMQHIVKLKTMVMVEEINKKLGYKDLIICTPEEVLG